MTRTGPKGPPLFDVLASKRREPSALELALQAAAAERLVDAASAATDPVSADEGGAGSEVEPATPKSRICDDTSVVGGRARRRAASDGRDVAVGRSGDMGAGPRIAAFAAATGAAVRRPTPPVEASLAPDGPQAGGQVGTTPALGGP